jgi:PAS domain S-box-containing protein
MFTIYRQIRKNLRAKILLALTISVAIVMALVIIFGAANQRDQLRKQMTLFGEELKSVAYAAIKYPMSIGDSASVTQQLAQIRDLLQGNEIIVCDFNQKIVFATRGERIGTTMADVTDSREILGSLQKILETGDGPPSGFSEEEAGGHRYLVTLHGLPNEEECHHCHGSTRKMLGGLITRQEIDKTYAAIATLRNRTIAISIIGIGAVVLLAYFLLSLMVTRPVEALADRSERIAHGELDVSVKVRSDDAIGVLGHSFNRMIRSIKDQIEYSNSLRDAIAAPLFIVDTDMVITYMNKACEKMIGYSKDEVEGKMTCRDVFLSDLCDTNCPLRHCLDSGAVVDGITATIKNRAGESIPIMTSANSLKDSHGNIIGAVEICKDIRDVLEAERLRFIKVTADREEKQRRYLEERVKGLLEVLSQMSNGNLKVRASILDRNDAMDEIARHVNLTVEELEKLYAEISGFNKGLEKEVNKRTKMLQEKTVLLERANRELRALDKLKSAFLANMSHELRTPMNSIIGYTDLMLDRIDGEINEEQEKSLGKVQNNAQHLLQLINDILDMAKIESGKIELAPQLTDIKEITQSIGTIFDATIRKKGLSLTLDIAENLPSVYVDEDKVRQIFINLLSNAVKFTDQGGVTIRIRPADDEVGQEPGSFVEICIEDTGIGIRPEDMNKLYNKFSQIDVSHVRQYEGTGLGLSIARGLVVLHKGRIWTKSEFGRGSRFFFTLPTRRQMLEMPVQAVVDMQLPDNLAELLETDKAIFFQQAFYGGKPIKCWEFSHCGQISCPAYNNKELRCWLIPGTHCQGEKIVAGADKIAICKGCEIVERLQLQEIDIPKVKRSEGENGLEKIPDLKTVLVIDDNPEVIDIVKKYIGNDYKVVGLLSGRNAVNKAAEIRPVAITLDIMMPEKDGWQVLYELKQNSLTQDIPVIILSIVDNKKLGFSLGAAEYIVKPIDKDLLRHKLKSLEHITAIQNILVVDSNLHTVEQIRDLLSEGDYRIDEAYNSEEAADRIEQNLPDLIVLNPIMSEPEGLDVLEFIKFDSRTKDIPLILLTQKELSESDYENLNGRIQLILNKGILTEKELLGQLAETIKKYQRVT